ncbi:hypothetical protein M0R45_019578 [Rubus argutus]|uniref:Uncharacterized protein n=1 Tax=Rubus argutus TaxID=59490 RepID=A0AAW1X879_RUBAR
MPSSCCCPSHRPHSPALAIATPLLPCRHLPPPLLTTAQLHNTALPSRDPLSAAICPCSHQHNARNTKFKRAHHGLEAKRKDKRTKEL